MVLIQVIGNSLNEAVSATVCSIKVQEVTVPIRMGRLLGAIYIAHRCEPGNLPASMSKIPGATGCFSQKVHLKSQIIHEVNKNETLLIDMHNLDG